MKQSYDKQLMIDGTTISLDHPTYFIADIAANHDGDLSRAKDLIHLAAQAGANAAKFQHFQAQTIVSDYGFRKLGGQQSHQANWEKSVYEVYKAASLDQDWTPILEETCKEAGITFFTSPYSIDLVDQVDPYVKAYKVGSGDITWHHIIEHMASKTKPVILASGASNNHEVKLAMDCLLARTSQVALLQCNTSYTGSEDNFRHVQLNVLKTYAAMYPGMVLGLSDHTPGHAAVLGAVALGGRIIEKHFTDDFKRTGPDHQFSMTPESWKQMVCRTRELESALGNGIKNVELNEVQTVVLQRRAIRTTRVIDPNTELTPDDLTVLRPCPTDAIPPYQLTDVLGRKTRNQLDAGEYIRWTDLQ